MIKVLKQEVYEANLLLHTHGLAILTWGNASAIDREKGLIVIKPSGVPYETMKCEDMVVLNLKGEIVEGAYRPSSDTPTHLYLYKAFANIGGVVHTHSLYATSFAQAEKPIPCFGTTHADYFYGEIPCTRLLTKEEIEKGYEKNTGAVIAETFTLRSLDALALPAVLVAKHGPFTWGKSAGEAAEHALVLEEAAKMARLTCALSNTANPAPQCLQDKHYFRKHGEQAYYGQG